VHLVSRARSDIALDFKENSVCSVNQFFIETPVYTFTLPDLTIYPGRYKDVLDLMYYSFEIYDTNNSARNVWKSCTGTSIQRTKMGFFRCCSF